MTQAMESPPLGLSLSLLDRHRTCTRTALGGQPGAELTETQGHSVKGENSDTELELRSARSSSVRATQRPAYASVCTRSRSYFAMRGSEGKTIRESGLQP